MKEGWGREARGSSANGRTTVVFLFSFALRERESCLFCAREGYGLCRLWVGEGKEGRMIADMAPAVSFSVLGF